MKIKCNATWDTWFSIPSKCQRWWKCLYDFQHVVKQSSEHVSKTPMGMCMLNFWAGYFEQQQQEQEQRRQKKKWPCVAGTFRFTTRSVYEREELFPPTFVRCFWTVSHVTSEYQHPFLLLWRPHIIKVQNWRLRDHRVGPWDHQCGCRGGNRYVKGGTRKFDKKGHEFTGKAIN